jgi:PAS domain S-box-containing protein
MGNAKTIDKNKTKVKPIRKHAETRTGTEPEQFQELVLALLSSSQSVFYIVQDRRFQVVTPQLIRLTGFTREELLARDPLSVVHPDDRAMVRESAVKMLKGERSEPYEFRYLDKAGNIHDVLEVVTSITYKGKLATLGNWINLTEHKRAEEALRESEQFSSSLMKSSAVPILVVNDDTSLRYVNPAFEKLTGFTSEEAIGKMAPYPWWTEDAASGDVNELKEDVHTGVRGLEKLFRKKNGEHFWVEVTSAPVKRDGEFQYSLENWLDITERKQAEKALRESEHKYRTLVENLPQKIFLKDKNLVYVSCNENYARDLKIKPEEIVGKTDYDFFPKELAEKYRADDRKIMKLKRPEDIEEEYRIDGQEVFVHTAKTPIIGENGEATGILGIFWDITEKKVREQQLVESETRYRSIFESANDVIVLLDHKGNILDVNDKVREIAGYEKEDLVGHDFRTLAKIISKRSLAKIAINFTKSLAGINVLPYEVEMYNKNGGIINIEINAVPLRIDGKTAGDVAILRDITQQKRSLQAIKESEEKFSKAFRASPDAISINTLKDGTFLEVNDNFTRVSGYTREELIGHSSTEIGLWANVKERDRMQRILKEQGRVGNEEFEFRVKSGEIRHWLYSAEIINIGDEPCLIAMSIDITERKRTEEALRESEEKFSKAFRASPDAISINTLKDGTFLEVNDNFTRVSGYTREEVIGHSSTEIGLWAKAKERGRMLKILKEQGRVSNEEFEFRVKSGEIRHWLYSAEIINIGDEPCLIVMSIDITERKNMEDELRTHKNHLEELVQERTNELGSLNKQLEKELVKRKRIEEKLLTAVRNADAANRAKSDFLARMSHEIRTPIHGVTGTLDLLRDTELGKEQRQYVNLAKTSAETLLNVINDILDFSKIEAGKIDLENRDFNLHAVLEEAIASMAVPAHKKGLEILLQVSRDIPAALVGDAGRLRQVLVNLLGNAVKFTERGEIVLRVNVEADGEKEAELHFSVRDTGIGIPEEKQELLFHPFEQVDGSMNRKYGGSGLGLSICQQLVNMMSGRIWFTSWLGEGSVFHFTAKFGKQASGERADSLTEIPPDLRGMPLLLIEDNATCRAILRDTLNRWGFQVTEADNSRSALRELEDAKGTSHYFRIILLDKTLPTMNGFAVAEQILRAPALRTDIVMMLTADDISDDFARCQELGISHYMVKPIKESELQNIILTALGHAKTAKEAKKQASPRQPKTEVPHLRILVAEDNATSQLIAKKTLEKAGHAVQIAGTGVEAIRMVKEGAFDLVLMDVEMPEMNGLEATRFIRKTEKESGQHIPIIAMTAYAMKEDRQRCLEAGMDAYLSKPVNPDELYRVIGGFSFGKDTNEVMDIKAALELVGGDEDILREVVGVFLEQDYPEQLQRLKDGIDQHDAQAVKAAAHSIKGAVRSFGGSALSSTALRLEEMGRNNDLSGAGAALQELEQEAIQFADFFAQYSQPRA